MTNGQPKAAPPVKKWRAGAIELAVWKNESKNGVFYTFTFHRNYMDNNNQWQQTNGMRANDLPVLSMLCHEALKEVKIGELAQTAQEPTPEAGQ